MKNKKVLVVLGGTSGEREVSLDSGKACIKALKKIGYSVSTFDPKKKKFNLIDQNKTMYSAQTLHAHSIELRWHASNRYFELVTSAKIPEKMQF